MESLRRVLVGLGGLICLGLTALVGASLINHKFAQAWVDYLDRCLVYNLRLIFVESQQLWQPLLALALLLLLGGLLIYLACAKSKTPRRVRVSCDDGSQVEIALGAIDNVVRRAANSMPQIKGLTTALSLSGDSLDIDLNITVPAEEAIPALGAGLRQTVAEQVEAMTGVKPRNIRVQIVKVADKQEG